MKKSDNVHRAIAKMIDFVIVGALCLVPPPVGVVAGALYLLISDGFFNGQSVGKKLIGLRVITKSTTAEGRSCSFRESIIRNLPYGLFVLLGSIPLLGWFLFFPLGLVAIALEGYFAYADDHGIRIGDIFADTQVIDAAPQDI